MKDSNELILGNIIKLTRLSEKKFKQGNFKGAIDDKMKANAVSYTHLTLPTTPYV